MFLASLYFVASLAAPQQFFFPTARPEVLKLNVPAGSSLHLEVVHDPDLTLHVQEVPEDRFAHIKRIMQAFSAAVNEDIVYPGEVVTRGPTASTSVSFEVQSPTIQSEQSTSTSFESGTKIENEEAEIQVMTTQPTEEVEIQAMTIQPTGEAEIPELTTQTVETTEEPETQDETTIETTEEPTTVTINESTTLSSGADWTTFADFEESTTSSEESTTPVVSVRSKRWMAEDVKAQRNMDWEPNGEEYATEAESASTTMPDATL